MDPMTMYALIQGGMSLYNSMQGGDQEMQSFEGTGSTSPTEMLKSLQSMLGGYGQAAAEKLSQPVTLRSSYVQPLPTFSGGGLPMPVGLYGKDPAIEFAGTTPQTSRANAGMTTSLPRYSVNPDYLTAPGLNLPPGMFGPGSVGGPGAPKAGPSERNPIPGMPDPGESKRGGPTAQGFMPGETGDTSPSGEADQIMSWLKMIGGGRK